MYIDRIGHDYYTLRTPRGGRMKILAMISVKREDQCQKRPRTSQQDSSRPIKEHLADAARRAHEDSALLIGSKRRVCRQYAPALTV
jgi:hypothetical protein